ncbi:hypothetical protein FQN49_000300 [Arthroderma sp. PD_2]|nr:hypothetical protein FQN49_000300 [Arthroderma sp. PD_2]
MATPQRVNTENADSHFSRLEASFSQTKVAPRKNSIEMKDVSRHTQAGDHDSRELVFDFMLDRSHYPLDTLQSLQDVFPAIQYNAHFTNGNNFSDLTHIKCFDMDGSDATWHMLNSDRLSDLLQSIGNPLHRSSGQPSPSRPRRLLAFFVPLIPTKDTSFGSKIAMTQHNVTELFNSLAVNPLFLMNLLGRPDYWAPQTRWESDDNGEFLAYDFFCQHPRWNLQFQGAPLSVYVRYSASLNLTTYIISHKEEDQSIEALHRILNIAVNTSCSDKKAGIVLDNPFDIAIILSSLSFEVSKHHVKRFQRFMWAQVNKVDDHLAGLETNDRRQLSDLTKKLQIMSQNADSHLGNADVAIISATAIHAAHARLHKVLSAPEMGYDRAADSINYIIESLQKQKIWFLNYKNRKDSTMTLVYNLVTQQDAANNMQLAASMKRDSTSMNAIAALTMVFLPGTFTAVSQNSPTSIGEGFADILILLDNLDRPKYWNILKCPGIWDVESLGCSYSPTYGHCN